MYYVTNGICRTFRPLPRVNKIVWILRKILISIYLCEVETNETEPCDGTPTHRLSAFDNFVSLLFCVLM